MKKKVCISGATGFIGSRLTAKLKSAGYSVLAFSRNPGRASSQLKTADEYAEWDTSSPGKLRLAIEGAEAVVNLAGASILGSRWNEEYKQEIYNSRIDGTRALVEAINSAKSPPKVFISTSAVGYYGDTGERIVTEEEAAADTFLAKVTADWEAEAMKVNPDSRLVLPRIGIVLSTESGALKQMMPAFKWYVGGAIGSGKQYLAWIHIDDLVNMIIFAIENGSLSGAVNATSPNPVTMREFAKTLGKVMGKPSIFRVPGFAAKLVLGEAAETVLSGTRAIPKAALESGYEFEFTELRAALSDLINAENED